MAKPLSPARIKRWLRNTGKQAYAAFAQAVRHLLRRIARPQRRTRLRASGFVLPTAIMLLLVMSLVVGAILLRTVNRTEQAILTRREKVIYNAATPAIDRAKAKLEYMFSKDPRLPAGIPSQELLSSIMLNDGEDAEADDPYLLPDETRLTLNGQNANAWYYDVDNDGDGEPDDENGNGIADLRVAYSIIWTVPNDENELKDRSDEALDGRASNLQVRNGPIASEPAPGCEPADDSISLIENGWLRDPVSTAILRKNFQIDAVAIADNEDGTIATLEVQQEREADRGNKWGAWFRNDLEVFPGGDFRWNGAMHTAGSFIVGSRRSRFHALLVSSPASCIYKAGPTTSEITLDSYDPDDDNDEYQGQVFAGRVERNDTVGGGLFHVWFEPPPNPNQTRAIPQDNIISLLSSAEDDAIGDSVVGGVLPGAITLDPIALFTEDVSKHRSERPSTDYRDPEWDDTENNPLNQEEAPRVYNEIAGRPYIDDFYRADDRFGPVPSYGGNVDLQLIRETISRNGRDEEVGLDVETGEPIAANAPNTDIADRLTRLTVEATQDPKDLGFDGYWERRAWREGMRVIVGQRLELGNDPFATTTEVDTNPSNSQIVDPDKLTPNREHESLFRRTLRDNLPAAQTTAIYHFANGASDASEDPVAAILSTVHPGTAETLKRAAIFEPPRRELGLLSDYDSLFGETFGDDPDEVIVDFFTGRGTNGWELDISELDITAQDTVDAMTNLAQFAGDPEGAFPAVQEAGEIHPNPALTEWGNFSNLRRTLDDDLESLADYSNKHTAAITLGALAYNVAYLDGLDYTSLQSADPNNPESGSIEDVANRLLLLRDGDTSNGEVWFFPTEDLNQDGQPDVDSGLGTYINGREIGEDFNDNGSLDPIPTVILVNDDDEPVVRMTPSPEAYIEALAYTGGTDEEIKAAQETARLIYLKEQVWRDRKYGFRPSPTTAADIYQYTLQFGFNENPACDIDNIVADDCDFTAPNLLPSGAAFNQNLDASDLPLWDYNEAGTYDFNGDSDTEDSSVDPLSFGCDFSAATGNDFFGLGAPTDTASEQKFLALANNLCGATPKFPALYYVFPIDDHGHTNVSEDLNLDGNTDAKDEQPAEEADLEEGVDVAVKNNRGIMDLGNDLNNNGDDEDTIWYTNDAVVGTTNTGITYTAFDETKLSNIALKPLAIEDWTLPYADFGSPSSSNECQNDASATNINPNCQQFNLIYDGVNDAYYRVAFKDTAFYMGRDMMLSRALNLDAEMLSDHLSDQQNGTINGDTWFAGGNDDEDIALDGGLVYAFREDGLREDGIERPAGGGSCLDFNDFENGNCVTNVIDNVDPPVNPNNGISPKPVNFVPDPDRRVHSFRLINGEDISREPQGGRLPFGITFVSDNPVFVEGNFNCHKSPGGTCDNPVEEFEYTLSDKGDTWDDFDFYGRRSTKNDDFATADGDSWRYSEFLVDGFGIVSDNFCDGSIEDAFIIVPETGTTYAPGNALTGALSEGNSQFNLDRSANGSLTEVYGCVQNPATFTSFTSFVRPSGSDGTDSNFNWMRENPADFGSPIRISANGQPEFFLKTLDDANDGDNEYDGAYQPIDSRDRPLVTATQTQRVNAVMVSGIGPSRANQSYGGLHNFPRFTEDRGDRELLISGSFLQLKFSTYATGPYLQKAFEPEADPDVNGNSNFLDYYNPPQRLWGYDVGLQLVRPGPVSSRFTTAGSPRSEYYREIAADDPYMKLLRCADAGDGQLDPRVTNCP